MSKDILCSCGNVATVLVITSNSICDLCQHCSRVNDYYVNLPLKPHQESLETRVKKIANNGNNDE